MNFLLFEKNTRKPAIEPEFGILVERIVIHSNAKFGLVQSSASRKVGYCYFGFLPKIIASVDYQYFDTDLGKRKARKAVSVIIQQQSPILTWQIVVRTKISSLMWFCHLCPPTLLNGESDILPAKIIKPAAIWDGQVCPNTTIIKNYLGSYNGW